MDRTPPLGLRSADDTGGKRLVMIGRSRGSEPDNEAPAALFLRSGLEAPVLSRATAKRCCQVFAERLAVSRSRDLLGSSFENGSQYTPIAVGGTQRARAEKSQGGRIPVAPTVLSRNESLRPAAARSPRPLNVLSGVDVPRAGSSVQPPRTPSRRAPSFGSVSGSGLPRRRWRHASSRDPFPPPLR